jgi:dephospho-CoA kinase
LFSNKPIIGLLGGIGSGKSFIADLFGEFGCLVIRSDKLAEDAYNNPAVLGALREWWGDKVFSPDGKVNRKAISDLVFADSQERSRLEGLIHPLVGAERDRMMEAGAAEAKIKAIVWDSPLILETGIDDQCDALVFVDAPLQARLARVSARRGWNSEELARREKLQMPLDNKQKISDYVIDNTADADYARGQVKDVIFRILGKSS